MFNNNQLINKRSLMFIGNYPIELAPINSRRYNFDCCNVFWTCEIASGTWWRCYPGCFVPWKPIPRAACLIRMMLVEKCAVAWRQMTATASGKKDHRPLRVVMPFIAAFEQRTSDNVLSCVLLCGHILTKRCDLLQLEGGCRWSWRGEKWRWW